MPHNPGSWIDEVPDYEVRDGRMYIHTGDVTIIMPVHVFLEGCVRGKAAVAEWQMRQLGKGQVVSLPRP